MLYEKGCNINLKLTRTPYLERQGMQTNKAMARNIKKRAKKQQLMKDSLSSALVYIT